MKRTEAIVQLHFEYSSDMGADEIRAAVLKEVQGIIRRHEFELFIALVTSDKWKIEPKLLAKNHEAAFGPVPGAYQYRAFPDSDWGGVDVLCSCRSCRAAHALANQTPKSRFNQADIVKTPDGNWGTVYQTNPDDTRVQVFTDSKTWIETYPTESILKFDPHYACHNCGDEHQACPCGNPTYCPPDEIGEPNTRCDECDEAIEAAEVLGISQPKLIILTKDAVHIGRDSSLIDIPKGTRCAVRTWLTNGPAVSPLNVPVQVRQLVKGESYRTMGQLGETYIYQGFSTETNRHEFMPEKSGWRFDGGMGVHKTKIPTMLQHHFKMQIDHSQYRLAE